VGLQMSSEFRHLGSVNVRRHKTDLCSSPCKCVMCCCTAAFSAGTSSWRKARGGGAPATSEGARRVTYLAHIRSQQSCEGASGMEHFQHRASRDESVRALCAEEGFACAAKDLRR